MANGPFKPADEVWVRGEHRPFRGKVLDIGFVTGCAVVLITDDRGDVETFFQVVLSREEQRDPARIWHRHE